MMRRLSLVRSSSRRQLAVLLEHARYEVFPTGSIVDKVLEHVPRDVTVTITTSPRKGLEATVAVAEQLAREGYSVVPHVSARLVRDASHLHEVASRLQVAGVDNVFVPAGDADPPAGSYEAALPVLVELAGLERRFAALGITGYPESHPQISDDVTIQAMWDKRRYADYIVSNLCFDPGALREWIRRVRARGVALPLFIGVAGPTDPAKLLDMARRIGIAESARFAGKHLRWMARLSASPGGYQPERFIQRLASTLADPALGVEGLHLFTFNQLAEAEAWRRSLLVSAT
jgi:methylenetetrahydrofolate reductase (NADPH)